MSHPEERAWDTLDAIHMEFAGASAKHGAFASPHEAYAVLLEEVEELWDAIKKNNLRHACREALQVAAMGLKFLVDFEHALPQEQIACRECGCTDDRACVTDAGPCHWTEPDLCSACVAKKEQAA